MRLRSFSLTMVAFVLVFGSMTSSSASAAPADAPVDLVLGDSLAASFQPNGDLRHGYAEQLFQLEQAAIPDLRLVKLACPGETTGSIDRSRHLCPYPAGTQLDQAVAVLQSRDVAFVTLQIGSNDVIRCFRFRRAAFDQACVDALLPKLSDRLASIVQSLQSAAPGVPIIGSNYYDPLLVTWTFGVDPADVASIEDTWEAFNDALEGVYASLGVPVADVEGAFSASDFATIVHVRHLGDVPINVARVCQWTYACSRRGFDPHPNTIGYAVMTRALEAALP
jgi:lysophospholipase L1-like esterase